MTISRRNALRCFGLTAAAPAIDRGWLPFVPDGGAAPSTARSGAPIRLDTARNAYGPPAAAMDAIRRSVRHVADDSDVDAGHLRKKIAAYHRVEDAQIVLGCGAGEILRMAAAAFTRPGKGLVLASPTCPLIGRYVVAAGGSVHAVPLDRSYSHDVAAMAAAAREPGIGLVYVCNPNSPTGTITRRRDIDALLATVRGTVHVVVDEAHHDFVERTDETVSFVDRRLDDARLIVVRSFSNLYGLAGLRVGYAVTTPRIAALLEVHRLQRNVNTVASRAAAAALDDRGFVEESVRRAADDRQEFFNQVHARMLRVIDSRTNFVMLDVQRDVAAVDDHYRRHSIVLGPAFHPFDRHIRVSLGTNTDMREFWRVWDLLPPVARHGM